MKIDAADLSETPPLIHQTTRCHIPEVTSFSNQRLRTSNSRTFTIVQLVTFFRVNTELSLRKVDATKLDNCRGMLFVCACVSYRHCLHPVKQVPTNEWSPDSSNVPSTYRAFSQTPPMEKKKGTYRSSTMSRCLNICLPFSIR
jgi:hypothetical protein